MIKETSKLTTDIIKDELGLCSSLSIDSLVKITGIDYLSLDNALKFLVVSGELVRASGRKVLYSLVRGDL